MIKHAVKVIDTITFVVDAIGVQSQTEKLNEALIGLTKSHLKRNIGLQEFRNLGIVVIDFVCDLQRRRNGLSNSPDNSSVSPSSSPPPITALETNLLVKAWTKLYGIILDLVEREESLVERKND